MALLKLVLSSSDNTHSIELQSTTFEHPLFGGRISCFRGKTSGAYSSDCGTFQWTSAVQALTIFLIRSAIAAEQSAALSGTNNSPAASLDYALSKPPVWLTEMFGWDSNGEPLAKRLAKRSNRELKRNGPVSLTLNSNFIRGRDLQLYLDQRLITDSAELSTVADCIERKCFSSIVSNEMDSSLGDYCWPFTNPDENQFWQSAFIREISHALRSIDIFSSIGNRRSIDAVTNNPSFIRLAKGGAKTMAALDCASSQSYRMGTLSEWDWDLLRNSKPITIWFAAVQPATMAIITYLKVIKGLPICATFNFTNAVEIVDALNNSRFKVAPDICGIGIAPAASLLSKASKNEYCPKMLLPKLSHRILSKNKVKKTKKLNYGEYHFFSDIPTTASFYFDDLVRRGDLSRKNLSVHHADADDVLMMFRDTKTSIRSLQWFPHYDANIRYNNCELLDTPRNLSNEQQVIYFEHERFSQLETSQLFRTAVRNAWMELKQQPRLLESVVQLIFKDHSYTSFFSRFTGLHSLENIRHP